MKLHLGCGKRFLDGFIHVDLADYEHIDIKTNVDNLSIIKNETVDEIYASHVLEYFDRDEVVEVLNEWRRVLVKNGILRIAVPDFEQLLKIYNQTSRLSDILGPMYGKWELSASNHIYHKTVYDFKSICKLLEENSFKEIKKWDWKKVFAQNDNYDDHSQAYFPHMDKENGILVSLNIECKK